MEKKYGVIWLQPGGRERPVHRPALARGHSGSRVLVGTDFLGWALNWAVGILDSWIRQVWAFFILFKLSCVEFY